MASLSQKLFDHNIFAIMLIYCPCILLAVGYTYDLIVLRIQIRHNYLVFLFIVLQLLLVFLCFNLIFINLLLMLVLLFVGVKCRLGLSLRICYFFIVVTSVSLSDCCYNLLHNYSIAFVF